MLQWIKRKWSGGRSIPPAALFAYVKSEPSILIGSVVGSLTGLLAIDSVYRRNGVVVHYVLSNYSTITLTMAGGAIALLAVIIAAMALLATILRGFFEDIIQQGPRGTANYYGPFATVAIISALATVGSLAASLEGNSGDSLLDASLLGLATFLFVWAVCSSVYIVFSWVRLANLEYQARRVRSRLPLPALRQLQNGRLRLISEDLSELLLTPLNDDRYWQLPQEAIFDQGDSVGSEQLVRHFAEQRLESSSSSLKRVLDPNVASVRAHRYLTSRRTGLIPDVESPPFADFLKDLSRLDLNRRNSIEQLYGDDPSRQRLTELRYLYVLANAFYVQSP